MLLTDQLPNVGGLTTLMMQEFSRRINAHVQIHDKLLRVELLYYIFSDEYGVRMCLGRDYEYKTIKVYRVATLREAELTVLRYLMLMPVEKGSCK